MPDGPTARRRREDTWDRETVSGSDCSPSADNQDRSAQRTSVDPTGLSHSDKLPSWDEILSFGYTSLEQIRLLRPQTASSQAASIDLESPGLSVAQQAPPPPSQPDHLPRRHQSAPLELRTVIPSMFQQNPLTRSQPEPSSQHQQPAPLESEFTLPSPPRQGPPRSGALPPPQGSRRRVDRGRRFRPYQTPPIPRSLDDVRIPDHAELASMEQVHGRPGPMSDTMFYQFRRRYGLPPDIAFEMRARSMNGVYPSSLIYIDYERLARTPPQRHRYSVAAVPALYLVRILTVKQAPHREHIAHFLSKSPRPCQCHDCQYDRQRGVMRWPGEG